MPRHTLMDIQLHETHSIPLHCNVCPKKPDFSDVSHLLTHIASKGHLSHMYRLQVRAGSDATAKKTVTDYDEWYAEWNVDELMRERMSQKDKRKGGAGGRTALDPVPASRRPSAGMCDFFILRETGRSDAEPSQPPPKGCRLAAPPSRSTHTPADAHVEVTSGRLTPSSVCGSSESQALAPPRRLMEGPLTPRR